MRAAPPRIGRRGGPLPLGRGPGPPDRGLAGPHEELSPPQPGLPPPRPHPIEGPRPPAALPRHPLVHPRGRTPRKPRPHPRPPQRHRATPHDRPYAPTPGGRHGGGSGSRHGGLTPGRATADRALDRTRASRREAEEREPVVSETAHRLRRAREQNHFAEMFRQPLEGRGA
ncbi:DUF7620 family protein [Streptomyces sp. SPB074]|uniref:DUF7620 family protein n=1 Tax=Streptomyces sp. (strain SPB074) TaxID=465543 RepID=UPI003B671CB2